MRRSANGQPGHNAKTKMMGCSQLGQPMCGGVLGRTFTVTCATAGATIYVTIDGSRPTPANYVASGSSPVETVECLGNAVKARGYKAGLRASEIGTTG